MDHDFDQDPLMPAQLQAQLDVLQTKWAEADRMGPIVDEALRQRHQRHLEALKRALAQVESAIGKVREGTYGICDGCGKAISKPDLEHDPSKVLCADCAGHKSLDQG